MRLFVTGFSGFGPFATNPSAVVAPQLGLPYAILDVSFAAYEAWADAFPAEKYDGVLHLGVASGGRVPNVELVARDAIGRHADVAGVANPGVIDGCGPRLATLWRGANLPSGVYASRDAGTYLCNYALFRSLARWPNLKVGFYHIPPFERLDEAAQINLARDLITQVTQAHAARQ